MKENFSNRRTPGDELDSFDPAARRRALDALAEADFPPLADPPRFNLHMHSFFSFNADGHSPSRLAWAARRAGFYAAGLCDFDVLDGLEEFLRAGALLELRAAVCLETRVFVRELADAEINSPGEPGVMYFMGAGFPRAPDAGAPAAAALAALRRRAGDRNRALARRINERLPAVAVDYDADVVPLSPGGCPTERHLVRAYRLKARSRFDGAALADFWAGVMKREQAAVAALAGDQPAMEDAIRSALAKRGGIGYRQPDAGAFPPADEFIAWTLDCGAIPMATWLDGLSPGEQDADAMLDCMFAKGARALNIIPDRNHRVADPAARALKLRKLAEIVAAAEKRRLPINIGTELNKEGQPFADDTGCEALRPYRDAFLRGARMMIGQTLLARYAGFPFAGAQADAEFGNDRKRRNSLFEAAGALPPLDRVRADRLENMGAEKALRVLRDSAARNAWTIPDTG